MPEHISFFDAIEANKRNSIILMGVMFFIFLGMIWAISYIFDLGYCAIVMGFIFLLFYTLIAYYSGDKLILAASGAKEITRESNPFIFNVVEGLTLGAQIPLPKIYLINDPSPNAFATGRDPQHGSVALTSGLLQMMKREELEGVLAHEISHIGNYDIRFTMIAIAFVGAIGLLGTFTRNIFFFGGMRMGGNGNNRREGEGNLILIVIAIVLAIVAPISAQLVNLAISRQREYLADANGARMTRYPEGLASALEKIKAADIPTKAASDATAPLYFANPFPKSFSAMLSTHPPIDERIKRLRSM